MLVYSCHHAPSFYLRLTNIDSHPSFLTLPMQYMKCLTFLLFFFSLASHAERPNVILVFIDDMGYADFSCYGNTEAQTPHIDSLATEGLRFKQFYVNSPICSPSRVAISTGRFPIHYKITSFINDRKGNALRGMNDWLDPKAPMLARSLQEAGYHTGHFGKWHMGGGRDITDAPYITDYGFNAFLTNFEGMGNKVLGLCGKHGEGTA